MNELTVHQEGSSVRAIAGRLNFLFLRSSTEVIRTTYTRVEAEAREHFATRCASQHGPDIPDEVLQDILQESTLHWMYFYINNRLAVPVMAAEWDHPQTRHIIQKAVERAVPPESQEASAICARLMGISVDAYREWREDYESFLRMW